MTTGTVPCDPSTPRQAPRAPAWLVAIPAPLLVAALVLTVAAVLGTQAGARAFLLLMIAVTLADIALPGTRPASLRPRSPRLLLLWVPLQIGALAWTLAEVSTGTLPLIDTVQLALALGLANGVLGFSVAHELMHAGGRACTRGADLLLLSVLYGHFRFTHMLVHHRLAGTRDDPATAQPGESLYRFFGRSIVDGYVCALLQEADRLAARNRSPFGSRNGVLRSGVAAGALVAAVGLLLGAPALAVLVVQALIAVYCLEAMNYVQHYGLLRGDGVAVRAAAGPVETWDCGGLLGNWILLGLGDHGAHHRAGRRAQRRGGLPGARLPAPYLAMIVVAAVPPLWRAVMDERAAARRISVFHARDLSAQPARTEGGSA